MNLKEQVLAALLDEPPWEALCYRYWRPSLLKLNHIEVDGVKYIPCPLSEDGRYIETVELTGRTKAEAIKHLDTDKYEFIEWL